jgi:hypothetical protein
MCFERETIYDEGKETWQAEKRDLLVNYDYMM